MEFEDGDDCILLEDKDCYIVSPNENIKSNKELAEAKSSQGGSFYSKGQFLMARNCYSEAIQLQPDNPVYYANRAAANMSLGEPDTVLADLDKAITLDSGYLKAYTRKFNHLLSLGELASAEQTVEQIRQIDAKNAQIEQLVSRITSIKYNESVYNKAIDKGDYREALHYIDNIQKVCTHSQHVQLKRAEAMAHCLRHTEVLDVVDLILRKYPTNSEAYYIRGLSLYYQDNMDKALAHFEKALKLEPEHRKSIRFLKKARSFRSLKEQGKDALTKGDLNKAAELYKEVLGVDSTHRIANAKIHLNLSIVYGKQKKHNEAIKECDSAIELDKNYDKAYHKRAQLHELLENYEECVRDYEWLHKKLKTRESKENLDRAKALLARSKRKNYYKILGIAKTADDNEIKKAYRKKAMEFHPDRHPDADEKQKADQEQKFKDVGEAYNCLIDPNKRHRYDNGYDVDGNGPSGMSGHDPFRMFSGGGGGFHDDDLLNNIFFNFSRR